MDNSQKHSYTLQRILDLIENKGLEDTEFERDLELRYKQVADWKRHTSSTYTKMLPKIAKYFEVPITFFYESPQSNSPTAESVPARPSYEYAPLGGVVSLKIIGTISAGYNGEAIEEILGEQNFLAPSLRGYPPEECFLLQVKGNSMYPDYHDKDIVLVHRQTSVDSGSVAVILYNGNDATLKRVIYKPNEDWLELIPKNPEYPTKRIEGADLQECQVIGKVVCLIYGER